MARLRRLHSALRWSSGGAHAHLHGTTDGSSAGHDSSSGWSAGTPSAPHAASAPAEGVGAAGQAADAMVLGHKAGPRISRLGSMDVTTWWGQGPAAAKPAFMQMFSRSPTVTLSRCAGCHPVKCCGPHDPGSCRQANSLCCIGQLWRRQNLHSARPCWQQLLSIPPLPQQSQPRETDFPPLQCRSGRRLASQAS